MPEKKIYAQYGEIKLDKIYSKGVYKFISDDESFEYKQPWDGLLIHWNNIKGDNKIEYYNKNHELLKTINLCDYNPYIKDKYPLLSENMGYSAGFERVANGIQDDTTYDYFKHAKEYRTMVSTYPQYNNSSNLLDNKNKHIVVLYDLIAMNMNTVIGWESSLFILDSMGNEVGKLDGLNYDVSNPIISKDGKFLGFCYGSSTMDANFNFLRKFEGVCIYDLEKKNEIFEETTKIRGSGSTYGIGETKEGLLYLVKIHYDNQGRKGNGEIFNTYFLFNLKTGLFIKEISLMTILQDLQNFMIIQKVLIKYYTYLIFKHKNFNYE